MSLQVWLPLNGNLNNQGLSEVTSTGGEVNNEGILGKCYACTSSNYIAIRNTVTDKYDFSFSFWMKVPTTLSSTGAWNVMFVFRALNINDSSTENNVVINWADYNCIKIYDDTSHQNIWMYPGNQFNYDKWCHYTITHTGNDSSTTIKVYTDGILRGTFSNSHRLVLRSGNICLGSGINPSYGPVYFNDFRLYDHCLSAKEVKEISKGLCLHYKLADPYIESTTNLYSGWSSSCYNGVTGKYSYGTTTDIYYDTLDDIIRVRMGTNNLDAWPFVFFDNITPPSNGEYRTLSFDFYPTIMDWINFYSYNTSGTITWIANGIKGTGGDIPVNVNSWNHISVTIKNTGSASDGFGYMKIGLGGHASDTSNYWLFKNIQVEDKDHSTPFVVGSRDESIVYDCSGIANNGTKIGGVTPSSDPLPTRYEKSYDFDGNTGSIQIPNLATLVPSGEFTMNCWIYHDDTWSSKGYETIFGGPNNKFELEAKASTTNSPVLWAYGWGQGKATYELNKWNMITMTRNASETKFYINGELKITGSAGTIPSGNYFIGAWNTSSQQNYKGKISDFRLYSTVLSAEDIKELCSTSASIDKNGNMYAYEFKEE